jgi:hypothetical protein
VWEGAVRTEGGRRVWTRRRAERGGGWERRRSVRTPHPLRKDEV